MFDNRQRDRLKRPRSYDDYLDEQRRRARLWYALLIALIVAVALYLVG